MSQDRTWKSSSGIVFKIQPVSVLIMNRIRHDATNKPKVPLVGVKFGGADQEVMQENPDDPDFKEALQTWLEKREEKLLIYVWSQGIIDAPTAADVERLSMFMSGLNPAEIKFYWISELLAENTDDIAALTQAIVGQTEATAKGVAASEATFQRNR